MISYYPLFSIAIFIYGFYFSPVESIPDEINQAKELAQLTALEQANTYIKTCEEEVGEAIPKLHCLDPMGGWTNTTAVKEGEDTKCFNPSFATFSYEPCKEKSRILKKETKNANYLLYCRIINKKESGRSFSFALIAHGKNGKSCFFSGGHKENIMKSFTKPLSLSKEFTNLEDLKRLGRIEKIVGDDCVRCHTTSPYLRNGYIDSATSLEHQKLPKPDKYLVYNPIMQNSLRWTGRMFSIGVYQDSDLNNITRWRPSAIYSLKNSCISCHRLNNLSNLNNFVADPKTLEERFSEIFASPAKSFHCRNFHAIRKVKQFEAIKTIEDWEASAFSKDADIINNCEDHEACHLLYGSYASTGRLGKVCESYAIESGRGFQGKPGSTILKRPGKWDNRYFSLFWDPIHKKTCGIVTKKHSNIETFSILEPVELNTPCIRVPTKNFGKRYFMKMIVSHELADKKLKLYWAFRNETDCKQNTNKAESILMSN